MNFRDLICDRKNPQPINEIAAVASKMKPSWNRPSVPILAKRLDIMSAIFFTRASVTPDVAKRQQFSFYS